MAKRFKLRISLPSIQLCRSRRPSSFPKSPSPAYHLFSPFNLKHLELSSYPYFPDPPPTTPNHPPSLKSKRVAPVIVDTGSKLCNSPILLHHNGYYEFDEWLTGIDPSYPNKPENKQQHKSTTAAASVVKVHSSADMEEGSKEKHGGNERKVATVKEDSGTTNQNKKSVLRQLMPPCTVEEKAVSHSVAVVKRSDDPYEDFKISMLEMVLERKIFEAKDLEQLLQCFLSLNSRKHHAVIVAAFTEIWDILFI